jgi:hypothetical protein
MSRHATSSLWVKVAFVVVGTCMRSLAPYQAGVVPVPAVPADCAAPRMRALTGIGVPADGATAER